MAEIVEAGMNDGHSHLAYVEKILNLLPSPVLVHSDGRIRLVNDAFARVFGIDYSVYAGESCEHLLQAIKLAPPAINWIIGGRIFSNVTCECSPAGPHGPSLVVSQIDLGPSAMGDGPSFLALMTDITRQRLIEEEKEALHRELLEAQKLEAIGKLASG
ncbi:MAG: PAS domain-containing protein, partial [Rhodospirillales bacterium]|nr:PAS domain-containing protein [Rhodospirillales bacterium]